MERGINEIRIVKIREGGEEEEEKEDDEKHDEEGEVENTTLLFSLLSYSTTRGGNFSAFHLLSVFTLSPPLSLLLSVKASGKLFFLILLLFFFFTITPQ